MHPCVCMGYMLVRIMIHKVVKSQKLICHIIMRSTKSQISLIYIDIYTHTHMEFSAFH